MKILSLKGLRFFYESLLRLFEKKQDLLVSGKNIKTINDQSILGTGNIEVVSGSGDILEHLDAVATASESTMATASVKMSNNILAFAFGLPKGDKGEPGEQGIPGLPGKDGISAIITKPCIVYKRSDQQPAVPIGGYWDIDSGEVIPPEGWSLTYSNDKSMTLWMSSNDFTSETGSVIRSWSDPVIFQGKDGLPGKDSVSIEFIYCLTDTAIVAPTKPESVNEDDYIPTGWTDSPTGISILKKVEWVCTRKKENGTWSEWHGPTVWSRWGVDGKDGDGIEYIYTRTNNAVAPLTPVVDTESEDFQKDEYVPSGWTDDPTGVDSTYKWEWICTRRYNRTTSKWEAFKGGSANPLNAALWAKYGDKGDIGDGGNSNKVMYAKGADASADLSSFVDRTNINPGSIWGTVIPSYKAPEAIFAISAVVTYDNKLAYPDEGWQGPYLITGVKGDTGSVPNWKTYVYKQASTRPDKPTWNSPAPQGDWKDYPSGSGQWWQCIGDVNGVTNLVTAWSEVLPVNGQDGVAQDGKRTEFRFKVGDSPDVNPDYTPNNRQAGEGWTTEPPTVPLGKYLWMTTADINADGTLASNWTKPVRISGEAGKGIKEIQEYYMASPQNDSSKVNDDGDGLGNTWKQYIEETNASKKYLWNMEATVYTDDTYVKTEPHIISIFTVDGSDGKEGTSITGVTNWYMLNKSATGVTAGGVDGSSLGWSKTPQVPTADYPYLWNYEVITYSDNSHTITDARVISVLGPKGETGPAGTPGVSGIPGVSIELRYSVGTADAPSASVTTANLALREPAQWSLGMPAVTKDYPYIWIIQSRINYSAEEDPTDTSAGRLATGNWGTPTRLSGLNGIDGDGAQGKKGQIVYPAGVYDTGTTYTTDNKKAPYVLDTKDGNYYVLDAVMSWTGTQQDNKYPSEDTTGSWVKFDKFDAIYAKIGIIANGLIGSAVFNGDFMFSQQGCIAECPSYKVTDYENFVLANFTMSGKTSFVVNHPMVNVTSPDDLTSPVENTLYCWTYTTGEVSFPNYLIYQNGKLNVITSDFYFICIINDLINSGDKAGLYKVTGNGLPIADVHRDGDYHKIPNICLNFKTGSCWFGGKQVTLDSNNNFTVGKDAIIVNSDGSGSIAHGAISWDTNGVATGIIDQSLDQYLADDNMSNAKYLPEIPTGCVKTFTVPIYNPSRMEHRLFIRTRTNETIYWPPSEDSATTKVQSASNGSAATIFGAYVGFYIFSGKCYNDGSKDITFWNVKWIDIGTII